MRIRIGSRGSRLALAQSQIIKDMILDQYPDWEISIKVIKTKGDQILDKPISALGGKEIFIKEIEKELLDGKIDLAVHSMKDMPGELPEGLRLSFVPKREDYRDVLILKEGKSLADLPLGARIGTGSKRRGYQIKELRPDLVIVPIRGNVESRIKKMERDNLDGVILAAAGIHRLGLIPEKLIYFDCETMLPAPTQGILGIEIAESSQALHEALLIFNHKETEIQSRLEREFLRSVGGSCTVPVGAYARIKGEQVTLYGLLGDREGNLVRGSLSGSATDQLGEKLGKQLQEDLRKLKAKVYLVGAGPGDPELITEKGKRAIIEADTIVYDRLVDPSLLNLNPSAKKIYVGKEAGNHHKSQEEIQEILYQEACCGKIVTRLKGGDPYVFARGGEEGLFLQENNIRFETVPGVSSAIGGLAYAGIPATHRDLASSFHVITGHTREKEDLNYEALAKLKGTLVFLMGFSNLDKISEGLISQGKDPGTPVAVIQWATTSRQKTLVGKLSDICEKVQASDIESPALLVVGEVVALRDRLNFFDRMDLSGHNIVITREAKNAETTIAKFRKLGANVLSFPMIETVPIKSKELEEAIENIGDYDYIFFSSVNAVEYFFEKFFEVSDIRKLGKVKFCTIGEKTYRALKKYGIRAELMPDLFEGMEAVELLKKYIVKDDKILVPRAKLGRQEIVEELGKYAEVDEVLIYDTIASNQGKEDILEALKPYDDYEIVFTSSSTFKNFVGILGEEAEAVLNKGRLVSIGPVTSQSIREAGYKLAIEAKEYTIDGIIEALKAEGN